MNELRLEQAIEKVKDMIMEFGDGLLEFETKDINIILNQLELQENYNDMLVRELEDLKAENEKMKVGLFQRNGAINDLETENKELREENKELNFKNDVIENICLQHQELTQWIEEEIDNEPDTRIYEVSHDFLENLYERVHKLNHEPY